MIPSTKARKSGSVSDGVDAGDAASFGDWGTTFAVFVAGPWAQEDPRIKHKQAAASVVARAPFLDRKSFCGRINAVLPGLFALHAETDLTNICVTSLLFQNRATAVKQRWLKSSSSQPELFPTELSAFLRDRFGHENQIPAQLGLQWCRAS